MSRGRREIPEEVRVAVVEAMEGGASVREAAERNDVDVATAVNYWRRVYGGIPWPAQREPKARLRYIRAHRGYATIAEYECPHCGALVRHVALAVARPNYCPWCGKAVG